MSSYNSHTALHEHSHEGCHHEHNHAHENIDSLPVHINTYKDIKSNPFFKDYVIFEKERNVRDTSTKKLVISHEQGSIIDVGGLDYIELKPGIPDKILISACKTALKSDGKTAVISGFVAEEDTIEIRCSKASLTDDDIEIASAYHENQPITMLSIHGGSGLAAISFLGDHPELLHLINIDNGAHIQNDL